MRLDKLKIPKVERRMASLDVSATFGEAPTTVVLNFEEPTAAQLFQVPLLAKEVKKRNADWPDTLCSSVALLAVSHVPGGDNDTEPLVFYSEIADVNQPLFMQVMNRYADAFPDAQDLGGAITEAKNA